MSELRFSETCMLCSKEPICYSVKRIQVKAIKPGVEDIDKTLLLGFCELHAKIDLINYGDFLNDDTIETTNYVSFEELKAKYGKQE